MDGSRTAVVTGGTAYLGPGLTRIENAVIVVSEGRIEAAAPVGEVEIPSGALVIEASGRTVLPGFIDAHVHIAFAEPHDVLRGGVTTVRDLAWPREEIYLLAARSRETTFDGPLVLSVGPMLTVAEGYPITAPWAPPGTGVALDSADEATRVVAELAGEGVSAIKIALNPPAGRVLDDATLQAVVNEAHRNGLKVTAHIHGLDQLHRALDAGIDELAHMLMSPQEIPDETIERMVTANVAIVPTLSVFPRRDAKIAMRNLERFIAAGGLVVYGTDLGNEGPGPGIDRLEVGRMEGAGMSVLDIVRSATVDSARWLGLDDKGSITPGSDADVIAVEGGLDRAEDLTEIAFVMRAGRLIED